MTPRTLPTALFPLLVGHAGTLAQLAAAADVHGLGDLTVPELLELAEALEVYRAGRPQGDQK